MKPKANILYVEDDLYLGFVTKDNLELKGYTITLCKDGQEALDVYSKNKFDICILDIMLPKVDGFSLAKEIRKKNIEVPIIFLSAKSLKEDKIEGLTLGADDYITKPFSIEELTLKIEIFLKRRKILIDSKNEEEFEFVLGKYILNYKRLELIYKNQKQRLTLKEAELLKLLCLHRGQILDRSKILTTVWGEDDYFKGRSLDVFISRIRKYLSQDPSIHIENIHGVGFELRVVE